MKTSLFCAIQGAVGALAYDSLSHFKFDDDKRGDCRSLDGCGKAGKGNWVPDHNTIRFPHNEHHHGRCWDLCLGGSHCHPNDALGKVCFDFKDEGLVFDFGHIDRYKYEDVSVHVQKEAPPTDHSPAYTIEGGHCIAKKDCKEVKCHVPYFSLTDGGSYKEMCPLYGEGSWIYYIQIKATIAHGHKKYELYSRGAKSDVCWFSLTYCCTECPDCKKECHGKKCHLEHKPHNPCHGKECHYEHHHKHHHHHGYKHHHDKKGYEHEIEHHKCHHKGCHHKHHEHHHKCHDKGCHHDHHHHDHHDHHHKCHHKGCHHDYEHHYKRAEIEGRAPAEIEERAPAEIDGRAPADLEGRDKYYNGEKYNCDGKLVSTYGVDGHHSHCLSELAYTTHPNTCQGHNGHYLKYCKSELKHGVSGHLKAGDKDFGHFYIQLEKNGRHENDIIVAVNLDDNHKYIATEMAVFVGCDGGCDGYHQPNICLPHTYPSFAVEEKGLENFAVAIRDDFKCHGDYYIAIHVEICLESDRSRCHICKSRVY
ncbi:hypothetical protein QQZ08_011161 [Neonectria magnoliae]|uniref:Uncharacterized protein n=1 Tax=Neonectria magnoliae TaxID=2732573 RepID=A0ABR1HCN4_9HYPO